jgi:uncharacterized protein GlcG (DUF336 family)
MIKHLTTAALALAAISTSVLAQQQPGGGQPPPARGPDMALAVEAAQTAVDTCLKDGVKGTASVVDSGGVLRVLISAAGSSAGSVENSPGKAVTAVALKEATSAVADRMEKDAAFKAKIEGDLKTYPRPRPGGLPLMVGNDLIGAIGFGGAPTANGVQGGLRDEACAKAGLAKVKARLK